MFETTVVARAFGLILTYPGITAREINTTLRETCDIDNTAAVNSALTQLKAKGCVIAVKGPTARSTMYYQGDNTPVFRSAAGVHRKDARKALELSNEQAKTVSRYYEIKDELAQLLEKMKDFS